MRQRAGKQLWTLILALTLFGSGVITQPRQTWADSAPDQPSSPAPPPDGTGDPDWPGGKKMPEGTPPRGGVMHRHELPVRSIWAAKWMWSIRMAVASVSRFFLRF